MDNVIKVLRKYKKYVQYTEIKVNIEQHLFKYVDVNVDNISNIDTCIVIPCYNRKDYIEKTFDSLTQTGLESAMIIIIDDASNNDVFEFIKNYHFKDIPVIKLCKYKNSGMYSSFVIGFDIAVDNNMKYLITLDSDTIHKKDWLQKIKKLYTDYIHLYDPLLITGFNTRNHQTLNKNNDFVMKNTIGGINMLFDKDMYVKDIRNIFINSKNGWDWAVANLYKIDKNKTHILCTVPSVIQHIGSNGLNSKNNRYDKAIDF